VNNFQWAIKRAHKPGTTTVGWRLGAGGRGLRWRWGVAQDVTSEKSPETLTKCLAAQILLKFSARKAI